MFKQLHFKSWILLVCMLVGASSAWAEVSTLVSGSGTSGYTVPTNWTVSGTVEGGSYLKFDNGTITSPVFGPHTGLSFTYTVATFNSGTNHPLTIRILNASTDNIIVEKTTSTPTSSSYISTNSPLSLGDINVDFKIQLYAPSGKGVRLRNYSITGTPVVGEANTITAIGDTEVGVLKSITLTPESSNDTTPFTFSTTSDKISLSTAEGTSCTVTGLAVTGETDAVVTIGQVAGTHDGTNYQAATPINVNVSVVDNRTTPEISFSTPTTMNSGDEQTVTVTTTHTGTRSASSSNDDIVSADVDEDGNVYLLAGNLGGTATITLNIAENGDYKATSNTFTVTVDDGKSDPTITIDADEVGINATKTFTLTSNSAGAITVTMDASYEDYALLNDKGDGTFELLGVAVGTVTVNVSQAANGSYRAYNTTFDIDVVDNRSVPTFSFSAANKEVEWDDRGDYVAPTLTNSSDVAAVYSSSNTGVATVNASTGAITFIAGGETMITARISGSATYKDAEASYTLIVNKPFEFSETFNNASISSNTLTNTDNSGWTYNTAEINTTEGVNGTKCIKIASGSSGGSVTTPALTNLPEHAVMTFQAMSYGSDTGVTLSISGTNCTVSKTSFIITSSYATYTVSITKTGNNPKVTISSSTSKKRAYIDNVTITDLPKATITIGNINLKEGETANATVTSNNTTGAFTFVSSDDDIATVAKVGDDYVVTGVGEGVATITATQAGTDYFKTTSTTFTVTVLAASAVMNPTLGVADGATVEVSDNITINAETGCTIKYTTDGTDPTISGTATTVDDNTANVTVPTGVVSLTLKAVAKNGENFSEVVTATYTVVKKTLVASFDKDAIDIAIGANVDEPTLTNPSGGAVTWSSSDETVATVDSEGQITALKEGSAVITATIAATDTYLAGSANYTVNVYDPLKIVVDFNNNVFGLADNKQEESYTLSYRGVTFDFSKGTASSNSPRVDYAANGYARIYTGNTLNVKSPSGYYISKIVFDFSEGNLSIGGTTYNSSNTTWTGASENLTVNGGTAKTFLNKMTITLTAGAVVTVTSAQYATYCSVQNLDFSETGIKVYTAKATATKVELTEVSDGIVPAGAGVVLYSEEAVTTAVPAVATGKTTLADNELVGITTRTQVNATEGGKTNYILANEPGTGIGFYKASNGYLAANRAYLSTATAAAASRFLKMVDEGGATGIETVHSAEFTGHSYYDLQGRRVDSSQLRKGLYIMNGKKTVIK